VCLPCRRYRGSASPQDTQREIDGASRGVRPLSAKSAQAVVTRRFASPTPSALRVSHPLSGLIPPGPGGFVSRHIRPQGFGLQSFSHSVSRCVSRRPLLSCRWASSTLSGRAGQRFAPVLGQSARDLPHAKTEPLTSARATLHHNLGINRAPRRPRSSQYSMSGSGRDKERRRRALASVGPGSAKGR
jgi:hypothetical protein